MTNTCNLERKLDLATKLDVRKSDRFPFYGTVQYVWRNRGLEANLNSLDSATKLSLLQKYHDGLETVNLSNIYTYAVAQLGSVALMPFLR